MLKRLDVCEGGGIRGVCGRQGQFCNVIDLTLSAGVCDSPPVSGRCEQADAPGAQAPQLCDTHQLPRNRAGLQVCHLQMPRPATCQS